MKSKELNVLIRSLLCETLDEPIFAAGFTRRPSSMKYGRVLGEWKQRLDVAFEANPHPGADILFTPWIRIEIATIRKSAATILAGDPQLQIYVGVTIAQPLANILPKSEQCTWYAQGEEGIPRLLQYVANRSGIPFFDRYATAQGLVVGYESRDPAVLWSEGLFTQVVAAYVHLKRIHDAEACMETHFGRALSRKRFAVVYEYLRNAK